MFELLSIYAEPLFWLFPVATSLLSMLVFMLFAGPLTWLALKDPPALRTYKIQSRTGRSHRKRIIWPAIKSWATNNLVQLAVVVAAWPLLRMTGIHWGPMPEWWVVALQVIFFVYLDDFLFYWMHRTLHTKWLFRHVHNKHHRIRKPWAITGHYMHPVEFLLTAAVMLVGPVLVGAHLVTLWIWVVLRQWEAAEGHCGYDFPWTPTHFLPFNDGARHHDFHHAKVQGNYAGFLAWVDGVFSTYVPGYRPRYEEED